MTGGRSAAILGDQAVGVRTFVLDERIRYSYSAPVTDLCQYLRIVPPVVHGRQRRRRWELRVDRVASSTLRTFSDAWGNLTMAVNVGRVDEAVEFIVHVEVDVDTVGGPDTANGRGGGSGSGGGAGAPPVPLRTGAFSPTRLTAADASMTRLTGDLGRGGGDVASLCERVHASIAYEWGVTGVHTTAGEALAGGRGVCQDYAHIMIAVCRLAGVPARYVSGHLTGEGGSHAWVEVLQPQPGGPSACGEGAPRRWQGWDPTHNRRTDADYLVVAVGSDYDDAAPLWGTFDGDGVCSRLVVEKRLTT